MRTTILALLLAALLPIACGDDQGGDESSSSSTGSSSTGDEGSSSTGDEPEPVRVCKDSRDCDQEENCSQTPGPNRGGYCASQCYEGKCGTGLMCKDQACITPCTKENDCEARGMECVYFSAGDSPQSQESCRLDR